MTAPTAYSTALAARACTRCRCVRPTAPGRLTCDRCRAQIAAYLRRHRLLMAEYLRCRDCGRRRADSSCYCEGCRDRNRRRCLLARSRKDVN